MPGQINSFAASGPKSDKFNPSAFTFASKDLRLTSKEPQRDAKISRKRNATEDRSYLIRHLFVNGDFITEANRLVLKGDRLGYLAI